jgi:superfamily II DNA/RNA helicase
MNHEDNNTKVDAHSVSQIDALARRLSAESDNDFEVTTESAEVALSSGPTFSDLGLNPLLIKALSDSGYTSPTNVQVRAIPAAMNGADLRVASNTGSGKTAAFMLPALERIAAARGDNAKRREKGKVFGPRVLVLAPTRELALQVAKAADTYGRHLQGLRVATIVGGVPYAAQLRALRGPLDVLIATPGRLLDHLGSGAAVLSNLEVLVLDEADRMLDMGFIEDIEAIAEQTPENRQTLMFSATFAGHVGKLAERLTRNAQHIEVASHTDSHDNIEQRLHLADTLAHKNDLLDHLLTTKEVDQAVVFTSTQRDADILADRLADMGHAVAALHGGMPQGRRNRVLQGLRHGDLRVLVATDVAARGIDVPTITHVINYGMPMKPEDYVHRIGRTGRAGRSGLAVTLAERRDIPMVRRIERFTTQRIPESVIAGLEPKMKSGSGSERPAGRGGKPMGGGFRGGRPEGRFGGDRGGFGGGDRGGFGGGDRDRGHFGGNDRGGDRGSFGAPRNEGFKPYGDRPSGDRPAYGGKPAGGKPFGAKPGFGGGDRPSYGDRPAFGGKPGGNKPFGAKPGFKAGGPKPGFGGKRPGFAKREG